MNNVTSFEQLQTDVEEFRSQIEGDIVIHGAPRIAQVGEVLEPRISKLPARDNSNEVVHWDRHEPYVFGAYPEYLDVGTFFATVMGIAPPYTAGIWEDPEGRLPMRFMANSGVKADVIRLDPVGTFCALPSESFHPSPRGARFEAVSTQQVRVIGAWLVRHSTLSFSLAEIPPRTLPGVSEDELAALARSSKF